MSTTRIVFIIVCAVFGILVFTLGIIIQKNNPESKSTVKDASNPRSSGEPRKWLKLPKNPKTYLTIFLFIVLAFLFIAYGRK